VWVVKPVSTLTEKERSAWERVELKLPLSQTLNWARAIEAVSGRTYLVFSPDEEVGGMVFSNTHGSTRLRFECINGPFLHWDNPQSAPRQLATFAMAVSKIDRNFGSLSLKPRWEKGVLNQRLPFLPVDVFTHTEAATLLVPVKQSEQEQFQDLSSRMRRTLSIARRNEVTVKWEKLTPALLKQFVPTLKSFGESRGFTVPSLAWFEALIAEDLSSSSASTLTFWLVSSRKTNQTSLQSLAQLLVCIRGDRAHYLFGCETRASELRSSISTSTAAHWETIRQCASRGVKYYDLNGYLSDMNQDHPYYGVGQFKSQFQGTIVRYEVPEFVVE